MIETKNQALFAGHLVEPELADSSFEWDGLVSWCIQLMRTVKRPGLVSLPQTRRHPPCFLRIYIHVLLAKNPAVLLQNHQARLHVIDLSPVLLSLGVRPQPITELVSYDTTDGVYDVA
ncbi:hypothetical protein TB2_017428 [Malus domestica]